MAYHSQRQSAQLSCEFTMKNHKARKVSGVILAMWLVWPAPGQTRPITITYVTMRQLQIICRGPALGCAFWRNRSKPCQIYLPYVGEPSFYGQMITYETNVETMAHERRHCEHGV